MSMHAAFYQDREKPRTPDYKPRHARARGRLATTSGLFLRTAAATAVLGAFVLTAALLR